MESAELAKYGEQNWSSTGKILLFHQKNSEIKSISGAGSNLEIMMKLSKLLKMHNMIKSLPLQLMHCEKCVNWIETCKT